MLLLADHRPCDGSLWVEPGKAHVEKKELQPGRVFFIDNGHPEADDANPGTEAKPWKTIRHASDVLKAAETVLVKKGTYSEFKPGWTRTMWATPHLVPKNPGRPGAPLTFRAYPGHDVMVTGKPGGARLGNARQYVIWWGFKSDRHVMFRNAKHSALINCEIIGQYKPTTDNHDGIRVELSEHIVVKNCVIRGIRGNSYNSAGIKCYDVTRLLVDHCDIHNCNCCVFDKDAGKYNVYRWCFLRDPQTEPRPGSMNFHMHTHGGESTDGCELYYNVITESGIYYNTWNVKSPFRVHDNTFFAAGFGSKGRRMLVMFNNIYHRAQGVRRVEGGGYGLIKSTELPESDYNLFSPEAVIRFGVYTPDEKNFRGLANWQQAWGIENNSIEGDPLFVDAAGRDFRLREGSPCIDKGRPFTYAAGAGVGRDTIAVGYAWSFSDGHDVLEHGDTIQIGKGGNAQPATVLKVIDRTHLQLDRKVSWSDGDWVSFPFKGDAPDIGAYEFGDERHRLGPTWRHYPKRKFVATQQVVPPPAAARPTATTEKKAAGDRKYVPLHREDWLSYKTNEELFAKRQWWNFTRTDEWKKHIALVPDKTFKQVVRMTQPKQDLSGNPRGGRTFFHTQKFAKPLDNFWVRLRVRYSPGFTLRGSSPRHANASYKLFFILFQKATGRSGIEFANGTQYFYSNGQGNFKRKTEKGFGTHKHGGHVEGEWTDGEWYEHIIHREVTGPNMYVHRFYRRRLTENGKIVDLPWNFWGLETIGQEGQVARPVRAIQLGANKNKSNDQTQHLYWGPWEVVDGSRYPNPFNLPLK
ncbi:MAG: hypothetical protein AMK75_02870 [Planctomycetes bacterium SM23_65]|nr:MAG: hypothetical protein AMK75_02870 [Planctomycetes bacterium SM23_65]